MSSKHPKPGSNKPHTKPDKASEQHKKCCAFGSIEVRGQVETTIPAELVKKRDTAAEKQEARENFRLKVDLLGLVFVIIYAALTAFQGCETRKAVKTAQQANSQAMEAVRPWVGLESPVHIAVANGQPPEQVEYGTAIKNFGQSPAFNVITQVDLVIGSRGTDIRAEIDRVCEHIERDLLPIPLGVGEVIFPGGIYSFPRRPFLGKEEKLIKRGFVQVTPYTSSLVASFTRIIGVKFTTAEYANGQIPRA